MSSLELPNLVEPLVYKIDELTNSVWNSWAVTVPVAVKSANVGELVVPTPCEVPLPFNVVKSPSLVVTLVEKLPLSVCKLSIFVCSLVIVDCKVSTLDSSVVTLVEKLPLSVVNELPVASFRVTRVENELEAVVKELPVASFRVTRVEKDELAAVNEPLTPTAVKLLISEAFAPNEPLILAAICAELVTTFATFAPKCSFEKEPLISLAICAELVTTFATFEPKCSFENEPLISLAICAEELTTDPSASPSSDVNLDAKLLETAVNDPLTPAAVKVLINEALDPNEPLISAAICADELTTEPSASPSSLVILDAKLDDSEVNEPLIKVLDVLPKVESHTPVVTVPTEAIPVADVILFCAAVPTVPYNVVPLKVVTSALPNDPVLVIDPLITLLAPVLTIFPVAVKSSKVTSPLKSTVAPITLPNEPVLVADPLIVPTELIVRFEPLKVRLPVIAGLCILI